MFETLLIVLFVIVCFILMLFVLLQSGKGAGVGIFGGSGGGQSFLGTSAPDILTKITTVSAILFMSIAFLLNITSRYANRSIVDKEAAKMQESTTDADNDWAPEIKNFINQEKKKDADKKKKESGKTIDSKEDVSTPVDIKE